MLLEVGGCCWKAEPGPRGRPRAQGTRSHAACSKASSWPLALEPERGTRAWRSRGAERDAAPAGRPSGLWCGCHRLQPLLTASHAPACPSLQSWGWQRAGHHFTGVPDRWLGTVTRLGHLRCASRRVSGGFGCGSWWRGAPEKSVFPGPRGIAQRQGTPALHRGVILPGVTLPQTVPHLAET